LNRGGNFFVYKVGQLYLRSAEGRLERSLHELGPLYRGGPIEFALVKEDPEGSLLAGFCFEPTVDFTISRDLDYSASIVAYSFDGNVLKNVIDDIVQKSGFVPDSPSQGFIEGMREDLSIEMKALASSGKLSRESEIDMETVWSVLRYANFLRTQKDYSALESMAKAARRFGLPPINL